MSTDNIAEPRVQDVTDQVTPPAPSTDASAQLAQPAAPAQPEDARTNLPSFFNVVQAVECIAKHYSRDFKNLEFTPPLQATDGAFVEFVDPVMHVVVASARLRFRNYMLLNRESGDLQVAVQLSDLTFNKQSVPVSVVNKQQPAQPVQTAQPVQPVPSVQVPTNK